MKGERGVKNYKVFLLVLLLSAGFLLPVSAECKTVEHKFGYIQLPDNAYVTEVDIFSNMGQNMSASMKRDLEKFSKLLNMYQITINDGNTYRTAAAIAFFFDNELLREGRQNLTEEQKERMSFRYGYWQEPEIQQWQESIRGYLDRWVFEGKQSVLPRMAKMQKISFDFDNPEKTFNSAPSGFLGYEWSGIEAVNIKGEYGYRSSGSFAGLIMGMLGSFHFDCHTYNVQNKGVGAVVFLCVDSEKEYWQPIFKASMR